MGENTVSLGPRFSDALDSARRWHGDQVRKGTSVPYLAHTMAVAASVLEDGGDEDEAIAGLLHDAVEDTEATIDDVRAEFGGRVANIVALCTDFDGPLGAAKPAWRLRKEEHLHELGAAVDGGVDPGAVRVLLADKVHNVEAMLADHAASGGRSWERFNAPPVDQLWYYESVLTTVAGVSSGGLETRLRQDVARLREAIADLGMAE